MKLAWTRLIAEGAVPCTRSSHGVSIIGGDKLVVYGGEHVARTPIENEANSVWICRGVSTGSTAKWEQITCSGSTAPPSRIAHAQAVYKDRYVCVFGGRAGITMEERAMNDLWVLDTQDSYTWKEVKATNDPPEARSFHRMICLGEYLYVFGGCGAVTGRLADLHRFNVETSTWENLGTSPLLKGRGGPNVLPIAGGSKVAVVAGFAGEETKDGHCYDIEQKQWETEALTQKLEGLRPRSVCCSGTLSSIGVSLLFGGEVDPSDRGHEGAGGFENDVVVLDATSGAYKTTTSAPADQDWPQQRGWADAAVHDGGDVGKLFLFGGLSGDDEKPERLNDLWRLEVTKP